MLPTYDRVTYLKQMAVEYKLTGESILDRINIEVIECDCNLTMWKLSLDPLFQLGSLRNGNYNLGCYESINGRGVLATTTIIIHLSSTKAVYGFIMVWCKQSILAI